MKRRQALWLLGGLVGCQGRDGDVRWRGVMFGTAVSIRFRGIGQEEADRLGAGAFEVAKRVEQVASLWDENSVISQLNRDSGFYQSMMLQEMMGLAKRLHEETGGQFDPSVHSYAEWLKGEVQAGREPTEEEKEKRLELVDFSKVRVTQFLTKFERWGMSVSLNGIAQGFATDRVAEFLEGKVESALVNFGEYRVVGERPWEVEVEGETILVREALAVSSGSGERFSATEKANHLIDPKTGESPEPKRVVAVEAPEAWLADGLATVVAMGGKVPNSFEGVKVYRFRK